MKINMHFDRILLSVLEWEMFRILLRMEDRGSYRSPFFFQRFRLDRFWHSLFCIKSFRVTLILWLLSASKKGEGGWKPVQITGAWGPEYVAYVFDLLSSIRCNDVVIFLCWRHLRPAAILRTMLSVPFPYYSPCRSALAGGWEAEKNFH
jgi:hypothetical protein